jgi:hypothetical protein
MRFYTSSAKKRVCENPRLIVENDCDEMFCEKITTFLLLNTTLVDLTLRAKGTDENGRWLQDLFYALRINSSLKSLDVDTFHLTDELVCEETSGRARE